MQHLDEGLIHAWLDGALPSDEAEHASAHVASCAQCAAAVADARGLIAGATRIVSMLDGSRGGVIPIIPPSARPQPAPRSVWQRLHLSPSRAALAASILVAAGAVFTVRHEPSSPPGPAPAVSSPVTSAPAPTPAAAPAPTSAPTPAAAPAPTPKDAHFDGRRAASTVNALAKPTQSPPPVPAPAPTASALSKTEAAPAAKVATTDTTKRSLDQVVTTAAQVERPRFAAERAAAGNSANVARDMASEPAGLTGCYQFTPPVADTATLLHGLPERFALERLATNGPRNVVRGLLPNGSIDSVIPGSAWVQPEPNHLNITFAEGNRRRTIELELTAAHVTGSAISGDTRSVFPVERVVCPR